jgi:carboxymethylenebutenolidase
MSRIALRTGTPAEVAEPSRGSGAAGLVLVPDINGLRPLFDEHCARLAAEWDVRIVCPEPFPGREEMSLEERMAALHDVRDEDKLADVLAAADQTGHRIVHLMGFCMGGMYALKAAASPVFGRAVSFYGMIRVPEHWRAPGQGEPLDLLRERGASHVLALIGTQDPWVSVADGEALRELGAEVVVYQGAEHGFVHDPERPAHRPADAADAWRRAKDWLLGG